MNIEALEAGVKYLEQEPRRLDMNSAILAAGDPRASVLEAPPCGTVCCWAGALVLTSDAKELLRWEERPWGRAAWWWGKHGVYGIACEVGDLTYDESMRLFFVENWPAEFSTAYEAAESPGERVAELRAYWEHVKANWDAARYFEANRKPGDFVA